MSHEIEFEFEESMCRLTSAPEIRYEGENQVQLYASAKRTREKNTNLFQLLE